MRTQVHHYRYMGNALFSMRTLRAHYNDFIRKLDPRGGFTIVDLVDEETNTVIATGSARCSRLDNYNKKLGRLIAEGRARKMLKEAQDA